MREKAPLQGLPTSYRKLLFLRGTLREVPLDRAGPRRSGSRSKAPLAEDKDNANDQWTVPNILQCKGKSFKEELKGLLRLVPVILNRALDAALEDTDMAPTLEELNSFSLASPELAVVAPRARQVRLKVAGHANGKS